MLLLIHACAISALDMGVGARPAGMGNSFVAVADDVNSTYWNPAGLGDLESKEITLTYSPLYAMSASLYLDNPEMSQQFLSYAHPIPGYGTAGISIIRLNFGDIIWTSPDSTIRGPLSISQTILTLCYGMRFTPRVTLGAGVKGVIFRLGEVGNSSWTLDVGGLINLGDNATLGFSFRNVNEASVTTISGGENDILTSEISTGLSYNLSPGAHVAIGMDNRILNFGFEYWEANVLALRFGLQEDLFNPAEMPILSGGIGIRYNLWQLDYAYIFHRELSDIHYVSFTMKIKPLREILQTF
jgi:hypothetical protein